MTTMTPPLVAGTTLPIPYRGLSYSPVPGIYDEVRTSDGTLRPHARTFEAALAALGSDEIERRWEKARSLLGQNGVTYNVYADPRGIQRPWELDPFPLLVAAEEWRQIERGLAQRARLLDL